MKNNRKPILQNSFFPENRKGVSAVIATIILIALVLAAIAIVWVTVTNMLTDRLDAAESCMNIFEKVEINELYTCYNSTSSKFQFSISIKDIDVDEVVVLVSWEGSTSTYTLTDTDQQNIGLTRYPSGGEVVLPGKNSGLTYITNIASTPDSIKITPVINKNQCEVSDSVVEIYSC